MRNEYIIYGMIALCTLISMICLICAAFKRSPQLALSALIMLCTPLVGQVFYFGAFIAEKIRSKMKHVQEEDVGFSKERRGRILAPDYEDEIQTVPLDEMLIVSQDDSKRKYLLRELKKGEIENYSMLVRALDNEDSETAHYAASAISSGKAEFESNVRKLDTIYRRDGGSEDADFVRRYTDYMLKFLRSGILDGVEIRKYSFAYVNILADTGNLGNFLTTSDYKNIVHELVRLGEYTRAVEWAQRAFDAEPNADAYLLLIKGYYYTGRADQMYEVVNQLRKADVPLSDEGLETLRFFMRGAQAAASRAEAAASKA